MGQRLNFPEGTHIGIQQPSGVLWCMVKEAVHQVLDKATLGGEV